MAPTIPRFLPLLVEFALALVLVGTVRAAPDNEVTLRLNSSPLHPRYSEGAFCRLRSGRIIFYFSQFSGASTDFSPCDVAGVSSDDGGLTWSEPRIIVPRGRHLNLMDISLLRLADGRLAMFYDVTEPDVRISHPYLQISADEAQTWSAPLDVIGLPGLFVLNNDRVIQTSKGRLIMPLAYHRVTSSPPYSGEVSIVGPGTALWYLSDDAGKSWREAKTEWNMPIASQSGLQEPGVEELADGTLFTWSRTDQGTQYAMRSWDDGETWTAPERTDLFSPCSPAWIKRLPHSSALLALFNDHSGRFPCPEGAMSNLRTPLVAAVSLDGGRTWPLRKLLESDLQQMYMYASIYFLGDHVLLAYSTQQVHSTHVGEWSLRVRRVSLRWLLEDGL